MQYGSKQHKYLYKKKVNGKWRYWYKETKKDLDELVNEGKNKLQRLLDRLTKSGLHEQYDTHTTRSLTNVKSGQSFDIPFNQGDRYGKTFAVGGGGKSLGSTKKDRSFVKRYRPYKTENGSDWVTREHTYYYNKKGSRVSDENKQTKVVTSDPKYYNTDIGSELNIQQKINRKKKK